MRGHLMFTPDKNDLKLANLLIRKYRSMAILEADIRLRECAERGDKAGASLWMRVMVVAEFSELRTSTNSRTTTARHAP